MRVFKFLASFVFLFLFLSFFSTDVSAQILSEDEASCIGEGVAEYMNEVLDGVGPLNNVRLLSPVFNMTSPNFTPILTAMTGAGARFSSLYGVAGNAYNTNGVLLTDFAASAMSFPSLSGRPLMLTEIGMIEKVEGVPHIDAIQRLELESRDISDGSAKGVNYIGATLFDSFGTNFDSSFAYNFTDGITTGARRLSDGEIRQMCGGACGRVGVNYAVPFDRVPGFDVNRAQSLGMEYVTAIAGGTDITPVVNIRAANLTPVVRIGVMMDSLGFSEPSTLAEYINALEAAVNSGYVYVIVGPNEPETERWATPECEDDDPPYVADEPNLCRDPDWGLDNDGDRDNRNEEWHSLRPYPACPFPQPELSNVNYFMCGHDFVANEIIEIRRGEPLPSGVSLVECVTTGSIERCEYSVSRDINVEVDFERSRLPIMGLTEYPEGEDRARLISQLDEAQKMNEYVSWYLNGAVHRAENALLKYDGDRDDLTAEDHVRLVDFSGPLDKLLPWRVQTGVRTNRVQNRGAAFFDVVAGSVGSTHNQIAACVWELTVTATIPIVDIEVASQTIGGIPIPCNTERPFRDAFGNLGGLANLLDRSFIDLLGANVVKYKRIGSWEVNDALPPVDEEFDNVAEYDTAYKEWRGDTCVGPYDLESDLLRPFIGTDRIEFPWKACFDNPLQPNYWANLFPYIPYSSTEDRIGEVEANTGLTVQPAGDIYFERVDFNPVDEDRGNELSFSQDGRYRNLYFPHMEEVAELSRILQGTYLPRGEDGNLGAGYRNVYNTERCEQLESRRGFGDDLFGGEDEYHEQTNSQYSDAVGGEESYGPQNDRITIRGALEYDGVFFCEYDADNPVVDVACYNDCVTNTPPSACPWCTNQFNCQSSGGDWAPSNACGGTDGCCTGLPPSNPGPLTGFPNAACRNQCSSVRCEIEAAPAMSLYTKVPYVEEIWTRLVNGSKSVFRMIYPQVGVDTPVEEIRDIPAETNVSYIQPDGEGTPRAGDLAQNRPGSQARLYFPHIGSLYDYFLEGIQLALRPQDIKDLDPEIPGIEEEETGDGSPVDLSQCRDQSTVGIGGWPPAIVAAFNAASSTYGIPTCVLMSIAHAEGSRMRLLSDADAVFVTTNRSPSAYNARRITSPVTGQSVSMYEFLHCAPNFANAAGPMGITATVWGAHAPAGGYICNARDSIFAAAAFLVNGRLPIYGYPPGSSWSDPRKLCAAGQTYYGSCRLDTPTCNNLGNNYCDHVLYQCRSQLGIPADATCANSTEFPTEPRN